MKEGYICTSENLVYPGGYVEVVLERAASIEGRIVRADGSPPPPGLCIRFGRTMSAVTDVADDGAFRIGRLLASRSELAIGHAGTVRVANRWLTTLDAKLEPGEQRTDFVIRLPPLGEVRGRVVDAETRLPIAGATVNSSPTGRDGSYALPVSADNREMGGIHLEVFATGYLPLRTRHSETQPVALRPAREVSVLVVDEAGRPIPGTLVRVLGAELHKNDISSVANGVGRCRVRAPAGEASVIRCTALRHDPVEAPCEVGQTEVRVVIGLAEARLLIVATDEKGNPLEGAFLEDEVGRTWADAAGRIPIARPEGDAFLSAPGRERIPFEADESKGLIEFRLREAAPILLRIVYADGTPVPQAVVRSPWDSYWADADGRLSIDGYARGETVQVEYDVEGWQQTAIEVTAGEPLRTIRLPGRGEIVVRFAPAESNGEPPVARLYGPGLWKDELEFPFYERASPGEVRFSVQDAVAWLFFRVPPGAYRFYPDLRVRAGETIELNYDFPQPGRICGLVLGPNGDPLDDADVTLFEFGEERGNTDRDGTFELSLDAFHEDSAVGMIRLLVTHFSCAPFLTEPIDLGKDRDLTIRLSRGGTLGGRVFGIEGEVAVTILTPGAAADPVVKSGEDGRFSFQVWVRAGRHPIEIRTQSGETYLREVEIEDGVDKKVTFRLP